MRSAAVLLVLSLVIWLPATTASAATLNVVGGQLMGAWNVEVGGTFYAVEFLDGSCESLFSDCNALFDFPFSTQNLARNAADALMK